MRRAFAILAIQWPVRKFMTSFFAFGLRIDSHYMVLSGTAGHFMVHCLEVI